MKFHSRAMSRNLSRLFDRRGATTALIAIGLASVGAAARAQFTFTTPRIQGVPGASVTVNATELLDGDPTDGGDTLTLYVDKTYIGTAVTNSSGTATFTFTIPTATTQGIHSYSVLSTSNLGQGAGLALIGSNIVVIDTDAGTIGGNSTTFNGVSFTRALVGNNERFTFTGDLTIPAATYCVLGSHPLSLLATNDMTLASNAFFDVSAAFILGSGGGGAGGAFTANGGAATEGGDAKDIATGGSGGAAYMDGNSGNMGASGDKGTSNAGTAGTAGSNGVNATSGGGAGGAGGDIKLFASVINASGSSIYAAGGAGSGSAAPGQNGRFLYNANNSGAFGGTVTGARQSNFAGATAANNLITGSPQTPYIPDLPASGLQHLGAQVYGVTGLALSSFASGTFTSAGNAVAALYRVHVGPAAPVNTDFTNSAVSGAAYDYVFFINLSSSAITNPTLGIGQAGVALAGSSADKNPTAGTVAISSLAAGQVYATLVPAETTTNFNVTFSIGGTQYTLANATVTNGAVIPIQAPPPVASLAGAELQFDGVADVMSIPHAAAQDAYPLTLEAWINTTQTTASRGAIVGKYTSGSYNGYSMYLVNGKIEAFYFRSSASYVWDGNHDTFTTGSVADGLWHHIAFTVDGSGGKLFVDGVLKISLGWHGPAGATTSTQPLLLGEYASAGTPGYFGGAIDEVRVWNIAKTPAQVAADVNASLLGSENGLLAYYKLDEGAGILASDSTANHFDGAVSGATWSASGANINTVHVPYNTSKTFALAGFDPGGLALTYAVATPPVKGTLTQGNGALFTYTPGASYDGNDTFTYTASNGATTSAPATVNVNFGIPVASLTGTLQFNGLVTSAANQNVTFQFRDPSSGDVLFTRAASVSTAGAFSVPYVPLNNYNLWIKPDIFLAKAVAVTAGATTFNNVTAALDGGDANNDNSVDVTDFGILVGAYGSDSSITGSGYDVTADFNGDGLVDVTDFSILVGNYGQAGDM